jgi:hypothetical protein
MPLKLTEDKHALFKLCTTTTVGNRGKASFWKDRWLNGRSPKDIAPDRFKLAWCKNHTVAAALPTRRWMQGLRQMSTEQELQQFIELWTQLS